MWCSFLFKHCHLWKLINFTPSRLNVLRNIIAPEGQNTLLRQTNWHAHFKIDLLGSKPLLGMEIGQSYELGLKEGSFISGMFDICTNCSEASALGAGINSTDVMTRNIPELCILSMCGELALNSFFSASAYQQCKADWSWDLSSLQCWHLLFWKMACPPLTQPHHS